ncbi:MAG: MBL fold metallo-hydrolase [Chloroflexi bacterium]|nr:MBL fold metallo-hydrolase [Chloroflexota bacterium]
MTRSLELGSLRLALILDARGTIEGDRVFHPAAPQEWSQGLSPDPSGNLPVEVNGLLISEGNAHTLVDTGFGEEERPEREENLLKSLSAIGIRPRDISRVILTHAHGDHCLGNTLLRQGRWLPTFPLAEYIVQEREIAGMRAKGEEIWQTRFQPLAERKQLRLIDGETELSATLACWPTPGHTAGHQSVLVRSGGQQALVLGDLAVLALNMQRPEWGPGWAWSFELDVRNRRRIAEWAAAEDAVLIAPHDPEWPVFRMIRASDGLRVAPSEG